MEEKYKITPWRHEGRQGGCAIDAPLAWLSLVGLRPRRAQLRFARQSQYSESEVV